jgi:hypothetical protein
MEVVYVGLETKTRDRRPSLDDSELNLDSHHVHEDEETALSIAKDKLNNVVSYHVVTYIESNINTTLAKDFIACDSDLTYEQALYIARSIGQYSRDEIENIVGYNKPFTPRWDIEL